MGATGQFELPHQIQHKFTLWMYMLELYVTWTKTCRWVHCPWSSRWQTSQDENEPKPIWQITVFCKCYILQSIWRNLIGGVQIPKECKHNKLGVIQFCFNDFLMTSYLKYTNDICSSASLLPSGFDPVAKGF